MGAGCQAASPAHLINIVARRRGELDKVVHAARLHKVGAAEEGRAVAKLGQPLHLVPSTTARLTLTRVKQ